MPYPRPRSVAALTLLLLAGCLGTFTGPARPGDPRGHQANPRRQGNALVFGEAHFRGEAGTLVDTLQRRPPAMTVRRDGSCPAVVLRSRKSMPGSNDPGIYVDGAMASNSCILAAID